MDRTSSSAVSSSQAFEFPDMIFISLENWDEIWRRNQFLCAGLAQRYPESKILFVGLAHDVSNSLRKGRFSDMRRPVAHSIVGSPNITFTQPLKIMPNSLSGGRRHNQIMMRRHLRKMSAKLNLRSPLLWINDHAALHLVGRLGERGVVYDITDDWTSLTQSAALVKRITSQDARLCQIADAVIVCSKRLWEMKRSSTDSLHLIANGVDATHYAYVEARSQQFASSPAGWRHPVLGYVGTIHSDRVDIPLLEAMARRMPEATIVMIGPNSLPDSVQIRLKKWTNIHFTGPIPYENIPDYIRFFDVCITPHLITPFTESLNPIKLWEYMATGKPIVSTRVAGFRDYPDLVTLADTADDFALAVIQAMAESPERAVARKAEARRNSWNARLDAIEAVIRSIRKDIALSDTGDAHAC